MSRNSDADLGDLNIDIIRANSAPAKGRVERANSTLQDRLVKELRLRGISSVDEANTFAPEFVTDYHGRFAKAPHNSFNAHRALLPTEVLDEIFTWQETRKLSQSLTFNYQRQLFLIPDTVLCIASKDLGRTGSADIGAERF